jgi:hypothetical protein
MRVRCGPWAAALAALLLAAACSSSTPKAAAPSPSNGPTSAAPRPGDSPSSLVGVWKVSGASGEPAGSVLRIGGPRGEPLILFRQCGEFFGGWVASPSGGFLGLLSGYSMACLTSVGHGDPTPPWIAAARSYAVRGSERELLTSDGRVLARLLPGGVAHAGKDMLPSLAAPPMLSSAERRKLDTPPRALPTGVEPARASALAGRWQPYPAKRFRSSQQPYVSFAADGQWTGSDGCNGVGGTLRVGSAGELINVGGWTTLIGCLGAPVGSFVPKSGRVSASGGVLTFYDANGKVLGKLIRS